MYAQEGLDDYLRTTTGCFDLADVGQLELVVDTREMVVSSLGQKLPRHTTTQLLPEHSFFRLAPGGPGGPRDLRGYLPRPSPPACLTGRVPAQNATMGRACTVAGSHPTERQQVNTKPSATRLRR